MNRLNRHMTFAKPVPKCSPNISSRCEVLTSAPIPKVVAACLERTLAAPTRSFFAKVPLGQLCLNILRYMRLFYEYGRHRRRLCDLRP